MTGVHPVNGLIPLPVAVEPRSGHVELPDTALVITDSALKAAASWWRHTCEDAFGVSWNLSVGSPAGAIGSAADSARAADLPDSPATVFRLDAQVPAGGYVLNISGRSVDIRAADINGAHAAAQTLRQLLGPDAFRHAHAGEVRVPCAQVTDSPRFPWRGLLLDVARHFMPKHGILRMIDLAAGLKLNRFQLHLTDDQGWRFEVRAHPRLTEVGGWRVGSGVGSWRAGRTDSTPHGGFYTQDDLREIVAYAEQRGITVVPEINVPGHSEAAIAAYPELGLTGRATEVRTTWGISEDVLRPSEATLAFYMEVLDELVDVFPSPVICLGGDEVPTTGWRRDPELVKQAAVLGLDDVAQLHGWFLARLAAHVSSLGRQASVWDEAVGPQLPKDVVVLAWRGPTRASHARIGGWDVVMSPEQFVYLDHRSDDGPDEPVPVGFLRTVDDVYHFEPDSMGAQTSPDVVGRLLGAQAALWTEHLDSARRVDFAAFPRLAAFAETVWSPPGRRDLTDFRRRLADHYLPALDALGVEYRPEGGPLPWQRRPGVQGWPRDLVAELAAGGWSGIGGWREDNAHQGPR